MAISMTPEQFNLLLASIREVVSTPTAAAAVKPGSFSNCTTNFWGERDHDAVEDFINTISVYKDLENISDADAIKGLPLLLRGSASTWWQGVKLEAKTWDQALNLIRTAFCPAKAPHQIYMEIFAESQEDNKTTDEFVTKKRALLAQLPQLRHDEDTQLDLIYGLLNLNIRDKVPRSSFKTFSELLQYARKVEELNNETVKTVELEHKRQQNQDRIRKVFNCDYCGRRGHTSQRCFKKQADEKTE